MESRNEVQIAVAAKVYLLTSRQGEYVMKMKNNLFILFCLHVLLLSSVDGQQLSSVDTLEAVDANGIRLGRVQDGSPHVFFEVGGVVIRLPVQNTDRYATGLSLL